MIWTLLLNGVGIFVIGYLLSGVEINNFFTALGVAVLLGLVNTFLKPLLLFLTFPLTLITFGLFILVINALMLVLVGALVDGFKIKHFGWAVLYSLLLSVLNLGFF